jgi:hypothetical protein
MTTRRLSVHCLEKSPTSIDRKALGFRRRAGSVGDGAPRARLQPPHLDARTRSADRRCVRQPFRPVAATNLSLPVVPPDWDRRPSRSQPPPGTSTGPTASVDGAAGASHRGVSTDEAPAASTIGADSGRGWAGKVTFTPTDPLGGGPHQFCHTNRTSADCPGSTSTVVCDKHPVAAWGSSQKAGAATSLTSKAWPWASTSSTWSCPGNAQPVGAVTSTRRPPARAPVAPCQRAVRLKSVALHTRTALDEADGAGPSGEGGVAGVHATSISAAPPRAQAQHSCVRPLITDRTSATKRRRQAVRHCWRPVTIAYPLPERCERRRRASVCGTTPPDQV